MIPSTIIMVTVAVIFFIAAWFKGGNTHILGTKIGLKLFLEVLPLLLASFIIAGIFQVLIPRQFIQKWLGDQAGLKGIVLGTIAGALTPGGPYISFPIVASLYKSGAGIGTTVAYLSGWALWAVFRIPFEVSLIGGRFVLIRLASTFFFPPIAGLIAKAMFKNS
ncbi:MAG: permease [Candidatus Omnitrophota bacterium]